MNIQFNYETKIDILDSFNVNDFYCLKEITSLDKDQKIEEANQFCYNIKKKFKYFIIIGIGGSINSFLCILNFLQISQDNIKTLSDLNISELNYILDKFDISKTFIFIISKSGQSQEIQFQSNLIIDQMNSVGLSDIHKRIAFITTHNGFEKIRLNLEKKPFFIDYDEKISGRFSAFSNVLLYPISLFNFNAKLYIQGALDCLKDFKAKNDVYYFISYFIKNIRNNSCLISYSDYLSGDFYIFYEQLLAESTGKDGKGINPISTKGIRDRHSVFQLFLDGPNDKIYTFLTSTIKEQMNFYSNSIQKEKMIFFKKTTEVFKNKNFPVRHLHVTNINEHSLGYLLCLFFIEIIATCEFLNVNPFNQPGVEKLKI